MGSKIHWRKIDWFPGTHANGTTIKLLFRNNFHHFLVLHEKISHFLNDWTTNSWSMKFFSPLATLSGLYLAVIVVSLIIWDSSLVHSKLVFWRGLTWKLNCEERTPFLVKTALCGFKWQKISIGSEPTKSSMSPLGYDTAKKKIELI